jgi:hypothetical protein
MSNIVRLFPQETAIEIEEDQLSEVDMDVKCFREDVIRPALKVTDLWSQAAENLLVGTAMAESGLRVLKQHGEGPALGPYQCEPATYDDCKRYLNLPRNKNMKDAILSACFLGIFPPAEALIWNLRLATLMARVKYWMIPEPLPSAGDYIGLCSYHKFHYNSILGKADTQKNMKFFKDACAIWK